MQIQGRRFDSREAVSVHIEGERVASVEALAVDAVSPGLPWIAPGLVDLQVNGFGGQEFNDLQLNVEDVARISTALDCQGVTRYCPTATTHSFEMLSHVMRTISKACDAEREVQRRVAGIHLEGPYISNEDGPRGAHPAAHVRPPDWDEFQRLQEAAGGRLRILTMSPEFADSAAFIEKVAATGVVVAIGHTSASSDQIRAAVDAGARLSTHLGNGAHGQIRRHPNYIWDQLAEDRLTASLIADGHHLPPSVLKCFVRAKSPDRCILVSDITGMAGMPPGLYENPSLGAVEVLEDGRLVIPGQRQLLAGAALPMTVGIANIVHHTDADLQAAIKMASQRPARLVGATTGDFVAGSLADFVLFSLDPADPASELVIRATVNAGEVVFGSVDA